MESAQQYDYGIYWTKQVDDPSHRASLFRNSAHLSATLGKETEWRRRLDEARRDTQSLNPLYREGALAMISYVFFIAIDPFSKFMGIRRSYSLYA